MAGIVARVEVSANAEAADATHQFVGINIGADLSGFSGCVEQLSAHGHEAVKEVGMQRVEADAVGLQDRGESMLRDQERAAAAVLRVINDEIPPGVGHQDGVRASTQPSSIRDALCFLAYRGQGQHEAVEILLQHFECHLIIEVIKFAL